MQPLEKNIYALVLLLAVLGGLSACAPVNKFDKVDSSLNTTCNGAAVQTKYIVHYLNGQWAYPTAKGRADFVEKFVRPNIDAIDFVEYDQKINVENTVKVTASAVAPALSGADIDNWGPGSISAPTAWQAGYRGQNVIVAVVDSGVDVTHPQLVNQIFYNTGEAGADSVGRDKRSNGVDDDNNGFVDDYAGYNFESNSGQMLDDVGHGTHVSGIIAAEHADTQIMTGHVEGVAPSAKILPVKFLGVDGGTLSSALQGIDYAVLRGAKIINASWGGNGCSNALKQKIADLSAKNVLFVSAAGNSAANIELAPEYPAAYDLPLQITVGALTPTLLQADYSNYSRKLVQLFSPGSNIISTVPVAMGSYAAYSGTSMATPFVSGAAAVWISANPSSSMSLIRNSILGSVTTDSTYMNATGGRLNLSSLK